MNTRTIFRLVTLVALFAVAILVLEKLRLPHDSLLWQEAHNTGHTPLFGAISLVWLGLFSIILRKSLSENSLPFILAFAATSLTGVITEFSQMFRYRDADVWDFIRDLAGAFAFLAVAYAVTRYKLARYRQALVALVASAVVMTISILPLAWVAYAYGVRDSFLPKILDFDRVSVSVFITESESSFYRVDPPEGFSTYVDGAVGKITFHPGIYPGIRIDDPYPDWTDYSWLSINCWSSNRDPFYLVIRIDDKHHNQYYTDRYNESFLISPGLNQIDIFLSDILQAPEGRTMDMTGIDVIHLFLFNNEDMLELYLDDPLLR